MKANPTCRKCSVVLDEENWYVWCKKQRHYICKKCEHERERLRREANPERARTKVMQCRRKQGVRPFSENKGCSSYLGVHIAEQVLSQAFKDVKLMPYGHPGYDVICNSDKLIDIKSACLSSYVVNGIEYIRWTFQIRHNTTADFFLCLAFDNREDLTPLHAWLIPGSSINHLMGLSIRESTIHQWDAYRLDISKISMCCDAMR